MKKTKTIICKKCNTEYSSQNKRCPNCNAKKPFNVKKLIISIVAIYISLCVLGLLLEPSDEYFETPYDVSSDSSDTVPSPKDNISTENTNSAIPIDEKDEKTVKIDEKISEKLSKYLNKNKVNKAKKLLSNLPKKEQSLYLSIIEKYFVNTIQKKELSWNDEEARSVAVSYNEIINDEASTMNNYLTLLENYNNLKSILNKYPKYNGKITDFNNIVSTTVYVSSRVKSSSHIEVAGYSLTDEYTDAYYVTGYTYLFGEPIPEPDYLEAIVISDEPLSKGLSNLTLEKIGPYKTVSDDGFEKTLDSYRTVSQQEIDDYNASKDNILKRKLLSSFMDDIETNMTSALSGNETTDLPNINNTKSNFNYSGNWSDSVSQRCFMKVSFENGLYFINIDWSSSAYDSTSWNFIGYYDDKENCIIYKNGICKSIYEDELGYITSETVYENGSGKIYEKDLNLYWIDNIENQGAGCIFKLQ